MDLVALSNLKGSIAGHPILVEHPVGQRGLIRLRITSPGEQGLVQAVKVGALHCREEHPQAVKGLGLKEFDGAAVIVFLRQARHRLHHPGAVLGHTEGEEGLSVVALVHLGDILMSLRPA